MINIFQKTPAGVFLLAGVFLFNTCSSSKLPIWLNPVNRNNFEFIHGFSKVSKSGKAEEYIGQARAYSLSTIAQAIKMDIDATSINKVKEIERKGSKNIFSIENSYEMIYSARTTLSLEGVEHIGEWEDDDYYYVYNRLSKAVYKDNLNRKISKALVASSNNLQEGIKHLYMNPVTSLKYFFSGLKHLIPFQDQLLLIKDPNNPAEVIHVDLVLRKNIEVLLSNIVLTPLNKNIRTNLAKGLPLSLEIKAHYISSNGDLIDLIELPVLLCFTIGRGSLVDKTTSDRFGNVQSILHDFVEIQNHYQVKAELDILSFTGEDGIGEYLFSEYKGIDIPATFIDIEMTPISIFLHIDEKSLGKTLMNPLVTPIIIKSLEEKMGAIFVTDRKKSNYILDIRIDTQKRGEAFSLFSAFAQMSIYLKDGDDILFANNFNDIKGTHTDYERASREALKKLAEKIDKDVSDEIVKQFLD